MTAHFMLGDGEQLKCLTSGQEWLVSWHLPIAPPAGTPHGSAGICVTHTGDIVLISDDGIQWDLPAGRPEGEETWGETLRREMREEACATVTDARLLGFCLSSCMAGAEAGKTLVRSFWRAQVIVDAWEPQFEISHRLIVPAAGACSHLSPVFLPVFRRAFHEAGVL